MEPTSDANASEQSASTSATGPAGASGSGSGARPGGDAAAAAPPPAPAAPDAAAAGDTGDEDGPENCPICKYIEEGPCAAQHVEWRHCKRDAKRGGEDWVEECQAQFKSLLGCMIQHKDYHEPLFDALQMDVERTSSNLAQKEGAQQQASAGGGGGGTGAAGAAGAAAGSGGGAERREEGGAGEKLEV